ncbi:hypothetical protein BS17DRAFT_762811 [Gyrodon lividus]|nr:hypothetical protein BS17DRAFT_762811 [Gyrodon lividus]
MPLPNSYLFCKALQGGDELDESQLPQWDSDPPYQEPEPVDTIEEAWFTKNLEKESRRCQEMRYQAGSAHVLMIELEQDIAETFALWWLLYDRIDSCTARRHREMAKSFSQWCSYLIYSWYTELQEL